MRRFNPTKLTRKEKNFGHWLAGFVDGEGSFFLLFHKTGRRVHPRAIFSIGLRADDLKILTEIKDFIKCGTISYHGRPKKLPKHKKDKPTYDLKVQDLNSLVCLVVPIFETFPLRAKKKRDFETWKNAVYWLSKNQMGNKQWPLCKIKEFINFQNTIRKNREFEANGVIIETDPTIYERPSLEILNHS